jgi:DNA-directed RNA polymerase specialized sigma24 family protein
MLSAEEFDISYQQRFASTVRYLSFRGLHSDAANEWAQAVWSRAWERRHQLRTDADLPKWVNSIAINMYRNALQSIRNTVQLWDAEICGSEVGFDNHILASRLLNLTAAMDRKLLHERFYMGHSDAEIARDHGISRLAVRLRFYRAKVRLQASLARPPRRPRSSESRLNASQEGTAGIQDTSS